MESKKLDQAQITVLEFPHQVRLRKEMYLIDPNHCIYEIIDNSVDEFTAGRCTQIDVEVEKSDDENFPFITIRDNGGGIPTTLCNNEKYKGKCQAYVALNVLNTSGKYGKAGVDGYKTETSGLHGVGASCVNAVSSKFFVNIFHDKTQSILNHEKGICIYENINKIKCDPSKTGTEIKFQLDNELWEGESFDFNIIKSRLKQLAYLNPGLTITFSNPSESEYTEVYCYTDGLEEYYRHITASKTMLDDSCIRINKNIIDNKVGTIKINIVFNYSSGYSSDIYGFVNNVATSGDHITGFNTGVAKAVMSYFGDNEKYKTLYKNIANEDCREGLVAIISIKVMDPKFEGQSKSSIKMPQVRSSVNSLVYEELKFYLDQHPQFVKVLAEKLEKAAKARIAAKRAREAVRNAKSTLESSLPGKLAACSNKKPEESEIFLVEGDSAAGSCILGRDSKSQAILPIFGKILNTEKARVDEVLNNSKLLDVIKALKCGIGKAFDITKLRYHKIIIMADADSDGFHISTLWITFFYKHMPDIIKNGHLYIALSPLYRVTEKNGKKEEFKYFYDDAALEKYKDKTKKSYHVGYIKGLGELQPQQLWDSTMNPETRYIIKVTEEDAETASKSIEICMGDNVALRKQFILENAKFD